MSLFTSGIRLGRSILRQSITYFTQRKLDFSQVSNNQYYTITF